MPAVSSRFKSLACMGEALVSTGGLCAKQPVSAPISGCGLLYMRNRYYDPQSGQFTQEDPIGLAGGLNLYGFADGDPINFSDPFGLCTEEDGWKDCDRMINALQGLEIVQTASASGEWTYAQYGNSIWTGGPTGGDCTDYCRSAVAATLGALWEGGPKANTSMFKAGLAARFTEVEANAAQPGDIVVQGGHAGVFTGVNSKGEVRALANNGTPMSSSSGYNNYETRVTTFAPGSFGEGPVRFYRALLKRDP